MFFVLWSYYSYLYLKSIYYFFRVCSRAKVYAGVIFGNKVEGLPPSSNALVLRSLSLRP